MKKRVWKNLLVVLGSLHAFSGHASDLATDAEESSVPHTSTSNTLQIATLSIDKVRVPTKIQVRLDQKTGVLTQKKKQFLFSAVESRIYKGTKKENQISVSPQRRSEKFISYQGVNLLFKASDTRTVEWQTQHFSLHNVLVKTQGRPVNFAPLDSTKTSLQRITITPILPNIKTIWIISCNIILPGPDEHNKPPVIRSLQVWNGSIAFNFSHPSKKSLSSST